MMMAQTEKRKFFYGWVILGQGFLLMAVNGGGVFYAFGIFFPEMTADLGWARGAGAAAFSIFMIMTGAMAAPVGLIITKVGIRKVMAVGNIMMVTALVLMSTVTEVWQLYLVYGILAGIAIVSSGYIPVITMANNWFTRRRALAIGICLAGVGVGTLVLAPVIRYLIDLLGWRQAWLALAGIDFTIALLPAVTLARAKPEDMGQVPDGIVVTDEETSTPIVRRVYSTPVDWGTKAALKAPAIWLAAAMMAANMFAGGTLSAHQVAYLQDVGVSPIVAASAIGLLVGISTLGRLSGGALGDRFEPRYVAALACGLQVIALIILINARAVGLIYLYVVIFGLPYGAIIVLFPAIIGAYFGRKNYSTIFGLANACVTFIGATGPVFAGFVFDATGSYLIPLTAATVFCALGGVCAFLARPAKPPSL